MFYVVASRSAQIPRDEQIYRSDGPPGQAPIRRPQAASVNGPASVLPGQRLLAQLAERDARGQGLRIGLDVDDGGLAGRDRALEGLGKVGGFLDRLAVPAEGAGIGGEVGIPE